MNIILVKRKSFYVRRAIYNMERPLMRINRRWSIALLRSQNTKANLYDKF
jgi:hypothetical protein